MEFQMIVTILLVGFVTLVLFKIFDFIEIKKNKFRSKHFLRIYHFSALIFSGIVYVSAMILGVLSIDNKEWLMLIMYWVIAAFSLKSFTSYVERFAYCLFIWNAKKKIVCCTGYLFNPKYLPIFYIYFPVAGIEIEPKVPSV